VVTRQLPVERRTGKVCRPKTDVIPLCHATNRQDQYASWYQDLLLHRTRRFFPSGGRCHREYSLRLSTEGWPGWVSLVAGYKLQCIPRWFARPKTVAHPSTNQTRPRVTLIETNALPISQTTAGRLTTTGVMMYWSSRLVTVENIQDCKVSHKKLAQIVSICTVAYCAEAFIKHCDCCCC